MCSAQELKGVTHLHISTCSLILRILRYIEWNLRADLWYDVHSSSAHRHFEKPPG